MNALGKAAIRGMSETTSRIEERKESVESLFDVVRFLDTFD